MVTGGPEDVMVTGGPGDVNYQLVNHIHLVVSIFLDLTHSLTL